MLILDLFLPFQTLRWSLPVFLHLETSLKDTQYKIYLWEDSSERQKPVATAPGHSYTIKVPKPGSYFLQIESIDGQVKSAPRRFFVDAMSHSTKSVVSEIMQKNIASVSLLFPEDNHLIATGDEMIPVRFSWRYRTRLYSDWALFITSDSGKVIKIPVSNKMSVIVDLIPGSYKWIIERDRRSAVYVKSNSKTEITRSTERAFRIEARSTLSASDVAKKVDSFDQNTMILVDQL
jgi:hypothetical protein